MNLLTIDTCTRRVGVAIARDGEMIASRPSNDRVVAVGAGSPRHVEELAPAIRQLLRESAMTARDIDAIAVTVGPGMFTGLRVGIATACTFASALRLPMIPLSSLEVLAEPWSDADCDGVVAMLDARRNELYYAVFPRETQGLDYSAPCDITTPETLAGELATHGGRLLLCGDAATHFSDNFADLRDVVIVGADFDAPSCASMVRIAFAKWQLGEVVSASDVAPAYLRQSDAEINVAKVSGGTM